MARDRAENLLGALSLVIGDRVTDAVATVNTAAGRSATGPTAAAALSALLHFLDQPSVDLLRRVLGLTSSGTVRLVDRLVESGYVTRGPGRDGRSTSVALTEAGRAAAEQVRAARERVLDDALAVLDPEERATFEALAGRVLAGMVRGPGATRWMCRLCDLPACGRDEGRCPVANAVREKFSS